MSFLLIIIFVVGYVLIIANEVHKAHLEAKAAPSVVIEVCPPHKWQTVDVKDEAGNLLRSKLVCDRCGPLKPL